MSTIATKRTLITMLGRVVAVPLLAAALASCRNEQAPPVEARPVGVVTVAAGQFSDDVQLSGEVQAKKDVGLAFRIGGRVLERPVNVGDRVKAGQVIARAGAERVDGGEGGAGGGARRGQHGTQHL